MEASANKVDGYVILLKTLLLKSTNPPAYNEALWLEPKAGASMEPNTTNPIVVMPRPNEPARAAELKALIDEFTASCSALNLEHTAMPQLLLTANMHEVYDESLTWQQFYFESKPMFVLFANLSQIELAVAQLKHQAYQQTIAQSEARS